MDRRNFLKRSSAAVVGASGALTLPVLTSCTAETASANSVLAGKRWGMVIDLTKCRAGCTACLDACREENNVAFHGDQAGTSTGSGRATLEHQGRIVGVGGEIGPALATTATIRPAPRSVPSRPPTSGTTASSSSTTTAASAAAIA